MGWEDILLGQQPRDTGYQSYFDNYMNQYAPRDQNYFFDMKDPEVQRYQEMSAEAPRSKGFIEDYLSRRPSLEEYKPSLGRKLGAFALGALSGMRDPGLAYQNAQRVRMDPYQNQLLDWQAEGQGINARAKSLDEAQKNELNAQKFGLVERAKAAMNAERAKRDTLSGATRFSGSVVSGQNTADRIENDKYNRLMEILLRHQSQAALEANRRNADADRDARLAFDKEKFEWEKTHPKGTTQTEAAENRDITALASRFGVPTKYQKRILSAKELADQAAIRRLISESPNMESAFSGDEDELGNILYSPADSWWGNKYMPEPSKKAIADILRRYSQELLGGQ